MNADEKKRQEQNATVLKGKLNTARAILPVQTQKTDQVSDFLSWLENYKTAGDTILFTTNEQDLISSLYKKYKNNEKLEEPNQLHLLKEIKGKLCDLTIFVNEFAEGKNISDIGKVMLTTKINSVLLQMSSTRGGAKTKYHKRILSRKRQTKKRDCSH